MINFTFEIEGNVFNALTGIKNSLTNMTPAMETVGNQLTGTIQANLLAQGRPVWSAAPSNLAIKEGRPDQTMLRTWVGFYSYSKGAKGNIWKITEDSIEVGSNITDEGKLYMANHNAERFPHVYIFDGDQPYIVDTVRKFIENNM